MRIHRINTRNTDRTLGTSKTAKSNRLNYGTALPVLKPVWESVLVYGVPETQVSF